MPSVHTAQKGSPETPGQWVLIDTSQAGPGGGGEGPNLQYVPLTATPGGAGEDAHNCLSGAGLAHSCPRTHMHVHTPMHIHTCTHSHVCIHVHSHAPRTLLCAHCTRVSLRVMAPASKSVAELPPAPGDTVPALALLDPQTLPMPIPVPPARNAHPSGPWVSGHSCPVLVHPLSEHAWSLLCCPG